MASIPNTPRRIAQGLLDGLVIGALTLYLVGLTLVTAPSQFDLVDIALLSTVYGLLAGTFYAGSLLLARIAAPLGLLASLAVGGALVWHLREQTSVALRLPGFGVATAAVGLAFFSTVRRRARAGSMRWMAATLAGTATLGVLALIGFYSTSNVFRWHLLRHSKLLGTPAYYLLADRVEAVRADLWAQRERAGAARPPPLPPVNEAFPEGGPPHIVFVMIDTLRADALAAYGGDVSAMPFLNRLAEESLVFTDVIANSSWTRPSVASFFTGLLPEEHGAVDRGYRLPEDRLTLAEAVRASGYETAAFVANFGAVGHESGFSQGFDRFDQIRGEAHRYARAEDVNAAVRTWLANRSEGEGRRPVFLYVHYLDPHTPYLSGGPASVGYDPVPAGYEAEVQYVDRALEELLDAADAHLPGAVVVFVTSDHGEEFGEHGEFGHGRSLYREVIRIPVILRAARDEAGTVSAELEARDFFDLLARMARTPDVDPVAWAEARRRRRRYTSVYATTASAAHRPYLGHVCMRAVEENGLFLIWSGYGGTYELYDRVRDPGQSNNLARLRPDRVSAMSRSLDESVAHWASRVAVEHTDETMDLLRALGYVE